MINEFVEKLIDRLEELKKAESDREDYSDNHDYYDDWEYAFGDGASDGRHYAYGRSIKIIKELAEEYKDVPDINVGKWIPVSEKLPDDFMSYEFLTIRKGQTLATITYYCVVNHKWYSNRKSTKEIDVVAWQPLPSYKGE